MFLLDACTSTLPGSAHSLLLWSVNECIIRFRTWGAEKKKLLVESQVHGMATNKVICTSERTRKAPVHRTEGGDKL